MYNSISIVRRNGMIVPNCEVVRNLLITKRHEHWTANNLVILLPEWTGLPKY